MNTNSSSSDASLQNEYFSVLAAVHLSKIGIVHFQQRSTPSKGEPTSATDRDMSQVSPSGEFLRWLITAEPELVPGRSRRNRDLHASRKDGHNAEENWIRFD